MSGKYKVWVGEAGSTARVGLLETDVPAQATGLLNAIVGPSGSTTFDAGISIVAAGTPPPELAAEGKDKENEKGADPKAHHAAHPHKR